MRVRLGTAVLLLVGFIAGCAEQTAPTPAPPPTATEAKPATEVPANESDAGPELSPAEQTPAKTEVTEEDMPAPRKGEDAAESPEKEAELLARLEKDPKNTELLIEASKLMQLKANLNDSGETDYGLLKKSAEYLHRAMAANPKVTEDVQFILTAGETFYNEACALAREKQVEPSLKALKLASEYGGVNLNQLKLDTDLDNIRETPEFADVLKAARAQRVAEVSAAVDAMFQEQQDFAFDFDLKDTDGKPLTKKDFEGKVLMVNVWGTWCPPCRRELPDLVAAYTKYKSQGFEIIGLNTENETGDEANELINESKKEHKINYRCALGDDKVFEQIPDYGAVPTTLFFDRQGKVKAKLVGMADEILLETIIERMLKDSPGEGKGDGEKKD